MHRCIWCMAFRETVIKGQKGTQTTQSKQVPTPWRAMTPPPRLPASWGANYEPVGNLQMKPVLALRRIRGLDLITRNYEDLGSVAMSAAVPATLSSLRAIGLRIACTAAALIREFCAAASNSQSADTDVLTSSMSL